MTLTFTVRDPGVIPDTPVSTLNGVGENIIPVIAKADTITKAELQKFKAKIMSELMSNGVQIYQFPTDDETVAETNKVMNVGIYSITSLNSHHLSSQILAL